ncbi:putative transcriptional regulatory protein C1683,13c [Schizosaccharomyces pombe 972h-] [Rhizoctonia solani]|uniref:Putative transcriptional regulatory protein C1683,13c [Schizosaccharomyces pombe 972h-] n=1 Tax=Rhizoctonia solani TaxID=456999 RepID=A0A0K6FRJ9_9AGAM|nr:putative transcriptional regulatory protein C1683,13c [Schizosaccharomyces pombe 972h-] [Rhizoctonia solani]
MFAPRQLAVAKKIQELDAQMAKAQTELNEAQYKEYADSRGAQRGTAITVTVLAGSDGPADLMMTYVVSNASWKPLYDVRASIAEAPEGTSTIALHYRASITQTTGGELVGRGSLTLNCFSSAREQMVRRSIPPQGSGVRRHALAACSPTPNGMALRQAHVASTGLLNTTFGIPGRSDIPSDEGSHKVVIAVLELPATLEWVCVPRSKESVFLTCKVVNSSEFTLLPGSASVFMDDNFVSKSQIEHVSPNESFKTSLGVDSSLRVTYPAAKTLNRKTAQSGFLFMAKEEQLVSAQSQRITIRNTCLASITVRVLDHVPVSTDAGLKVNLLSPNGLEATASSNENTTEGKQKENPWKDVQKGVKARWAPLEAGGEADFGSQTTVSDENSVWEAKSANLEARRYYGHSSTCVLSRDAIFLRHDSHADYNLSSGLSSNYPRAKFWTPTATEIKRLQRPYELWETENMLLELPSDDLMPTLLNSYFDNTFFPVVHQRLFEKQLREGLHKHDKSFLRLVLLVCANGARWCDDPRVLDERWPISRSAGHRWFRQFELWHKSVVTFHQLSLWDAQVLVLISMYFCGSSATYGAWVMVGAAIRMMQDIGSHRRKAEHTLESELHKRCFWAMLLLDRLHSVHFGRNGAIADSDFDLDEVLEVDDELWSLEPGAPPPTQPPGLLPKLRVFNRAIALTRISGRCLQTVYALKQTKHLLGIDTPQGLARIVDDINSRLLDWAHNMPLDLQLFDHFQPSSNPLPSAFINMWASYYETLISINRPFISKQSELAASCLAICREAAKAFSKMARVHCTFSGSRSKFIPGLCYPAFSSAMVLAIDLIIQDHVKNPTVAHLESSLDMLGDTYSRRQKEEDMMACIQVLEDGEEYFQLAGKLRDVVREFETSLRLQPLTPRHGSPRLHEDAYQGSSVIANEHHRDSQNIPYDLTPATDDMASQVLDESSASFDIFSGYEFAIPYFLEPGIASGFPQVDQLSNSTNTFTSLGIPELTVPFSEE